jgi:outer membrane protein
VSSSSEDKAVRIILILLVLIMPLPSAAQTSVPQSPAAGVTLAQAVKMADAHYPQIRIALEQQAAANAGISVSRTAYLPRFDTLWQTNRATANNIYGLLLPQGIVPSISGPVLASDNTRSAWSSSGGGLLSWQPFDFGLRRAQVNLARSGANAASAAANLTRLDVEAATANAYLDLATTEQLVTVARANVERFQTFANAVHVLVDNQLRPGADASQADAQLALAHTQLIQAETNVAVRRAILANFLGIPAPSIALDDALLTESAPQDISATVPITNHPAARQEAAFVNQQQAELSALSHSYAPQFNTEAAVSGRGAGTSLNGVFAGGTNGLAPDTLNWAVGVQVTFPAFDIFSLHQRKKVQEANVRTEQNRYDQTVDDLSAQAQETEAQLVGARQVAQNTPVELAAARESETQQRARFQSGLATVVDVAAAESVLAQAEADDAVARLNVWRSLASVAAAHGDLTPFLNQLTKQP